MYRADAQLTSGVGGYDASYGGNICVGARGHIGLFFYFLESPMCHSIDLMNVLDKLVFNLQTIATIPKGRRIGTAKEFLIVEGESPMASFWRWKNAESRDKAVTAICKEVRTTIAFAEYILEIMHIIPQLPGGEYVSETYKKHSADVKKIYEALLGAVIGINNLCSTYDADADVSGHLHPLISEIYKCRQHMLVVAPSVLHSATAVPCASDTHRLFSTGTPTS